MRVGLFLLVFATMAQSRFPDRWSPVDLDGHNGVAVISDASGVVSALFSPAAMIGDINDDGLTDFAQAGLGPTGLELLVIFGQRGGIDQTFSLADIDGSNGFRITDVGDRLGSVFQSIGALGDVNGDGIDDFGVMVPEDIQALTTIKGFVVYGKSSFSVTLDYADISGTRGFRIDDAEGRNSGNLSAMRIAGAGDVNCDDLADMVIGAPEAAAPAGGKGEAMPGAVFVVFGRGNDYPDVLDLDDLDGIRGLTITPRSDAADFGQSVTGAGDFNGDGCDDLAISDHEAPGEGVMGSGLIAVIFGSLLLPAELSVDALDGNNGMRVRAGAEPAQLSALGTTMASGDVNGDGLADLIAGAPGGTGGMAVEEGGASVIYGAADNPADLVITSAGGQRSSHTRGFVGTSSNPGIIGSEVASGDLNGDGISDLIFGSPDERPDDTRESAGLIYLVFGREGGLGPNFDVSTLGADDGFVFSGEARFDDLGGVDTLAAADVTGDGIDDLLIGGTGTSDRPDGSGQTAMFLIYGVDADVVLNSGFEAGEAPPPLR